jgi:hypothetical protein
MKQFYVIHYADVGELWLDAEKNPIAWETNSEFLLSNTCHMNAVTTAMGIVGVELIELWVHVYEDFTDKEFDSFMPQLQKLARAGTSAKVWSLMKPYTIELYPELDEE